MPPIPAQGHSSFPKTVKEEEKRWNTQCLTVACSSLRPALYSLWYPRNLSAWDITIPTVQVRKLRVIGAEILSLLHMPKSSLRETTKSRLHQKEVFCPCWLTLPHPLQKKVLPRVYEFSLSLSFFLPPPFLLVPYSYLWQSLCFAMRHWPSPI